MTTQEIKAMVAAVGVPYAYRQFTQATAQPPPFICFYLDGSDNVDADNRVYQRVETLTLELYTDAKDFTLEEQLEAILDSYDLPWDKAEAEIDSEQMHETIYTLDVLIAPSNPAPVVTT